MVRIVEYTITDPQLEGYGKHHRLVTSLLDPATTAVLENACAYHERWEIEPVIDEVDTHQRLVGRPLRSRLPVGVMQELYGLLIAHYVLRFLMPKAAFAANLDPQSSEFCSCRRGGPGRDHRLSTGRSAALRPTLSAEARTTSPQYNS